MDETMNKMEETKDLDEQIRDEIVDLLKTARAKTDELYLAVAQKYHVDVDSLTDDITTALRSAMSLWR